MKAPILLLSLMLALMNFVKAQNCDDVSINNRYSIVLPLCNQSDGSIIVNRSRGGTPPYRYQFQDSTISSIGAFFELPLGTYQLITIDGRSCHDTDYVTLEYKSLDLLIQPHNAFTPNGDNMNDIWQIPGIEQFQGAEVRVFNRWGQLVHVNSPYTNDKGWDGTQNGREVPEGTYYYIISVINNCIRDQLAGTVSIIR